MEYFGDSRRQTLFRKFFSQKHQKPLFEFFPIQSKTKTKYELTRCLLSHNFFVLPVFLF